MITVRIARAGDRIASYSVSGHSRYAEHGRDIICAAVSAVTQTALGGLQEVAGLDPKVVVDDDQGFLSVDLGSDVTNDAAQVILATMVAGLRAIAEQNPRYVKIKDLTSD